MTKRKSQAKLATTSKASDTPLAERRLDTAELSDESSQEAENRLVSTSTYFGGPLPPPQVLHGYEQACPGAAERILALAEREAAHRQGLEREQVTLIKTDLDAERKEKRFGQICGLTIASLAILGGVTIALLVPEWRGTVAASILGGGSLASLVAVFITGRRDKASALPLEERIKLPEPKEGDSSPTSSS